MSAIYFIIFILFVIYIIWTWRSTEGFETIAMRISYIAIGTIFITIITLFLFGISRIGVPYPKDEMIGEVRKIVLLIFIPINGFIVLTQFSSVVANIKSGLVSKEEMSKRIKRLVIVFSVMIILECVYFRHIQAGLIQIINAM